MIKVLEKYLRKDLPEIKPGYIVRVHQKYSDKGKERISIFEGFIISIKNRNSLNKTFTVRGKAAGQYLEKTYFYHSPSILKIEILGKSKVRRAKLYFIREISEHKIKKKLKPVYER
ncbi:MAG: 50S ribosomal protein L19 [Candidatus Aenigmatarchaeota archaeon]